MHGGKKVEAFRSGNPLTENTNLKTAETMTEFVGRYVRDQGNWELEREIYRVVYPQIGIHAAGGGHTVATFFTAMPIPTIPLVALGGAAVGHIVRQANIAQHNAEASHYSSAPIASVHR